MNSEKFQELVLQQLQSLAETQTRFESALNQQGQDIASIKKDIKDIKSELGYVWDDIKKIDNRLTAQGEELVILKRLK
ncbi:MAG: hypothetical protein K6T65_13915 [Peptococcaceae bacterium]|nr:hypothetical protein [Peptococcaceae bacterium]